MRCARLLEEIGDRRGKRLDLTGDDRVVEIYPAAALSAWGATVDGFDPKGYKTGPEAKTKRAALFDALVKATRGWLGMLDEAREACIKSDDVLDAFMAALATRAAQVGKTRNPETHAQRALAPVEGWIHVPLEGTLALLASIRR